jgi:hypothetical protein
MGTFVTDRHQIAHGRAGAAYYTSARDLAGVVSV